ncbi:hypothetical protein BK662_07700 [Pseudomonas frederiksbergensis]|uniref:Uncharacterized protein n=1 Tax=Pseudomonas frederiksbergensis TaxID=104087 RepID=A0A423HTA7_9PSED|nr:hypothetical protein BK662_07700 [Pseudomonas frederiksbergensis]
MARPITDEKQGLALSYRTSVSDEYLIIAASFKYSLNWRKHHSFKPKQTSYENRTKQHYIAIIQIRYQPN